MTPEEAKQQGLITKQQYLEIKLQGTSLQETLGKNILSKAQQEYNEPSTIESAQKLIKKKAIPTTTNIISGNTIFLATFVGIALIVGYYAFKK